MCCREHMRAHARMRARAHTHTPSCVSARTQTPSHVCARTHTPPHRNRRAHAVRRAALLRHLVGSHLAATSARAPPALRLHPCTDDVRAPKNCEHRGRLRSIQRTAISHATPSWKECTFCLASPPTLIEIPRSSKHNQTTTAKAAAWRESRTSRGRWEGYFDEQVPPVPP